MTNQQSPILILPSRRVTVVVYVAGRLKDCSGELKRFIFFSAVKSIFFFFRVWHFENKSLALTVKESVYNNMISTVIRDWRDEEWLLTDLRKDTWHDRFTANGEREERKITLHWLVGVMLISMLSVTERGLLKHNYLYVQKQWTVLNKRVILLETDAAIEPHVIKPAWKPDPKDAPTTRALSHIPENFIGKGYKYYYEKWFSLHDFHQGNGESRNVPILWNKMLKITAWQPCSGPL